MSRLCKISQSESLSAYADGMLDGQMMRRIAHHVDLCEDCRQALGQLSRTKSLMRSVWTAPGAPSPTFWADTYRRARLSVDTPSASPRARVGLFGGRSKLRLATFAALGVAAIGLSFLPAGTMRDIAPTPVEAAQTIDLNAMVNSHASITQKEPLADRSRLTMIESDAAAQQAGGISDDFDSAEAQGTLNAGPAFD